MNSNVEKLEKNVQNECSLADTVKKVDFTEEQSLSGDLESADSMAEVKEELDKLKDSNLRLMAEYDNYRKRTIKEKSDLIKYAAEKVLTGLLPVIDDFERALEMIKESNEVDIIKEGVDLIHRKFLLFLQQNGIKAIDSVGKIFEADLFEAVATVPADSEEQKGKILDKLQTGYTLNDKVIRHAKVVVAN